MKFKYKDYVYYLYEKRNWCNDDICDNGRSVKATSGCSFSSIHRVKSPVTELAAKLEVGCSEN